MTNEPPHFSFFHKKKGLSHPVEQPLYIANFYKDLLYAKILLMVSS